MKPHQISNQKPQQGNSVKNQQMFPNNRPIVAPSGFMNFPNQPFPMQNIMGQFPNGIGGFNPQQNFNPAQQQQGQFFAPNSMAYNQNLGIPNEQLILQNTIQNICQLLQLQNPNYAQCPPGNFPMLQNQIPIQNPGFIPNQQYSNGPMQHVNQGMMDASALNQLPNMGQQLQFQTPQPFATPPNFQIAQGMGMGPQNPNYLSNQPFGMTNPNGQGQHFSNQGQPRFVSPMMDVNTSRQMDSFPVQSQNPGPTLTNNEGNLPTNGNASWTESQRKNFNGHKKNDASHKGFKPQFQHVKEKFGNYNGNMNKEGNSNGVVNSGSRNSTNHIHSEKKAYTVKYTDQEIKQWREARKKHFPTSENVEKKLSDVTNQEAMLRRQQLKEVLEKQAELGVEVADIPRSYLSGSEKHGKNHEREQFHKKGKFHNKRGTRFQDNNRFSKKTRTQDHQKDTRHESNQKCQPSLLKKLLTGDIKRDKNHLLQVFRFITINSFFTDNKSLRFPNVIVRETNPEDCLDFNVSEKAVDVNFGDGKVVGETLVEEEGEEGEITD